jgi:hypothetical protein
MCCDRSPGPSADAEPGPRPTRRAVARLLMTGAGLSALAACTPGPAPEASGTTSATPGTASPAASGRASQAPSGSASAGSSATASVTAPPAAFRVPGQPVRKVTVREGNGDDDGGGSPAVGRFTPAQAVLADRPSQPLGDRQ